MCVRRQYAVGVDVSQSGGGGGGGGWNSWNSGRRGSVWRLGAASLGRHVLFSGLGGMVRNEKKEVKEAATVGGAKGCGMDKFVGR